MAKINDYDAGIIGGGLGGLSLAIQLARAGHSVIVFEKEQYPFHRVCGEYISLESWDFLQHLGVDLLQMDPPIIKRLQVSAVNGQVIEQKLPLGGFGISRYILDHKLAQLARSAGVVIEENTKVNDIITHDTGAAIHTSSHKYSVKVAAGSFGKRSNIDVRWRRSFTTAPKNKLNNYIGIKYHIHTDFPADTIALHTFHQGYCGLVKVEGDKYNLCYLTTADNLQKSGGNILQMEQTILSQNPRLKKIFENSKKYPQEPATISQISFEKKTQSENHVLMIGDAAGMITPLCGNGMSMAMHGSKIAAKQIQLFLQGTIGRNEMEQQYTRQWQQEFGNRLKMGRTIQRLSLNMLWMKFFIASGKIFPLLVNNLIKKTHGKPF